MKAIGYQRSLPIEDPQSLVDFTTEVPQPGARDLLVRVQAVSVNPVDTKVRVRKTPPAGEYQILGWDAVGVVEAVGADVTLFKSGDAVFYAGSIVRPGTNAEFHLVDERIVGRKPKSLSVAQTAAMPLTTITAWELLFDRFQVSRASATSGALLIAGGAGGVGSMLIQLARQLTSLTVIATASRAESRQWCLDLGAHHVVDHSQPLAPQLKEIGFPTVPLIASLTGTEKNYPALVEVLAPQGKFGLIDDPKTLDVTLLKQKSGSLHWEFMYTRSMFGTEDIQAQHRLLNEVADLIDAGKLRTTLTRELGTINAVNLREAHREVESGRMIGKIVLEGF
ncbi:MAG: NADPH:quinone reductase [Verrucomicrobia bacterium Tous-C9LFEB]|nr:MAG: NADPH:quinone reductase [Verrucomicrobia bacterium Tous-C9LFEB]